MNKLLVASLLVAAATANSICSTLPAFSRELEDDIRAITRSHCVHATRRCLFRGFSTSALLVSPLYSMIPKFCESSAADVGDMCSVLSEVLTTNLSDYFPVKSTKDKALINKVQDTVQKKIEMYYMNHC